MYEFVNISMLRGVCGMASTTTVADKQHVNFSLLTQHSYIGKDGIPVVDCFWANVSAFQGATISAEEIVKVTKGAKVEVIGRLRQRTYTDAEGNTRHFNDVYAQRIHVLPEDWNGEDSIIPKIIQE